MTAGSFLRDLPKAELHLHLEGTIDTGFARALAARNGIDPPKESRGDYASLEAFLAVYYARMDVLRTRRDFRDLTRRLLRRCRAECVRHVEISFDPQPHLDRGLAFEDFFEGIDEARVDTGEETGVGSSLILCINRDRDANEALELLDRAAPYRQRIAGIGLDSAEHGNPPVKFVEAYRRARDEGYRLTAHCDVDQENSVRHIWQCLDELGVERIDHGVNAVEDPKLMAELRNRRICLTVCPTWRPLDPAPRRLRRLRQMLDQDLRVTVNTDDPALFASGYLASLLEGIARTGDFGRRDFVQLMRNAFLGAWCGEERRRTCLDQLEEYAGDGGG